MKNCSKCGKSKQFSEFPKLKSSKDGLYGMCKVCVNLRNKSYRDSNKENVKKARRKYYQDNIEKMREEKKQYYQNNKVAKAAYDKVYREENADRIAQYKKNWEKSMSDDPVFKIKRNMRRRLNHVLSGNLKADKTFSLVGCTAEELKSHLESQFQSGMSWDNYGKWHIDHIKPCSMFDFSNPEDQRKCFHYTNLQPLWAKDNLRKGSSYHLS